MEKVNAVIISYFMNNINPEAVEAQKRVVAKYNKSGYPHFQILTDTRHGHSMDAAWIMNNIKVLDKSQPDPEALWKAIPHDKLNFDVVLFLDIDAIPLNDQAIDSYINQAYNGVLVGNIQRSNHINNNQHVFVAPSAMAISLSTFLTIGKPSATETRRSDVGEEYTWGARKTGTKIKFYMPLRFDGRPAESESWALADGMPHYGRGTTFGDLATGEETFWHNFQSFHSGQHERFMAKCQSILGDSNGESQHLRTQASEGTGTDSGPVEDTEGVPAAPAS